MNYKSYLVNATAREKRTVPWRGTATVNRIIFRKSSTLSIKPKGKKARVSFRYLHAPISREKREHRCFPNVNFYNRSFTRRRITQLSLKRVYDFITRKVATSGSFIFLIERNSSNRVNRKKCSTFMDYH